MDHIPSPSPKTGRRSSASVSDESTGHVAAWELRMLSAIACLRSDILRSSSAIVVPGEAGITLAVGDGGAGLHRQADIPQVQHGMAVDQFQEEAQRLIAEPRMVADPLEVERLERCYKVARPSPNVSEGLGQLRRRQAGQGFDLNGVEGIDVEIAGDSRAAGDGIAHGVQVAPLGRDEM